MNERQTKGDTPLPYDQRSLLIIASNPLGVGNWLGDLRDSVGSPVDLYYHWVLSENSLEDTFTTAPRGRCDGGYDYVVICGVNGLDVIKDAIRKVADRFQPRQIIGICCYSTDREAYEQICLGMTIVPEDGLVISPSTAAELIREAILRLSSR